MEGLANAAGHEDRHAPLKNYCKGLSEAAKEGAIMAGQKGPVVRLRNGLGHAQ